MANLKVNGKQVQTENQVYIILNDIKENSKLCFLDTKIMSLRNGGDDLKTRTQKMVQTFKIVGLNNILL